VAQKERWRAPVGGGSGGGTLTTAGNLVFQVINDGRLFAYRADTGEKLLEMPTGVRGGMGPPITYMLDGKQYVALMGGQGGGGTGAGGAGAGGAPTPGTAGASAATAGAAQVPAAMRPQLLTFALEP
jgi:quinohemoprotein ethanol dehydrogenase